MKMLIKVLLVTLTVVCFTPNPVSADNPSNSQATAAVTCTVDTIMEWSAASFSTIAIADITHQNSAPFASQSLVLYTNGNVDISANNTTTAQLSLASPADTLVTEYKLEYDKNGSNGTGGSTVDWTDYSTFLSTPSTVTHVNGDGAVNVTLSARASNDSGNVANAGDYTATQTLTAAWGAQ